MVITIILQLIKSYLILTQRDLVRKLSEVTQ